MVKRISIFCKEGGGENLIVYDFDGPRTKDGTVTCLEVTPELLKEKIEDTRFPFGHGYVVAASIAGISTNIYMSLRFITIHKIYYYMPRKRSSPYFTHSRKYKL